MTNLQLNTHKFSNLITNCEKKENYRMGKKEEKEKKNVKTSR